MDLTNHETLLITCMNNIPSFQSSIKEDDNMIYVDVKFTNLV